MTSDHGWGITHHDEALTRINDVRSVPLLGEISRVVGWSRTRRRALAGLALHANCDIAKSALRDALWDAEDQCCEIACAHAPLDDGSALVRVREIAADDLLDEDMRVAARRRLASR